MLDHTRLWIHSRHEKPIRHSFPLIDVKLAACVRGHPSSVILRNITVVLVNDRWFLIGRIQLSFVVMPLEEEVRFLHFARSFNPDAEEGTDCQNQEKRHEHSRQARETETAPRCRLQSMVRHYRVVRVAEVECRDDALRQTTHRTPMEKSKPPTAAISLAV